MTAPHVAHFVPWVVLVDINNLSHSGFILHSSYFMLPSSVACLKLLFVFVFFFLTILLTSSNMTYHDALSYHITPFVLLHDILQSS